jgi:selenium-binding protein 1
MALRRPDSTFYSSPKMAMRAPPEILAYVVVLSPNDNGRPDALAVLDVDPVSETSGQVVGRVEMPNAGDELHERTGYSCPHTVHCGPEGIYVGALGAPDGNGPGGVFVMDHESFEPLGRWEVERGPQYFAYDFWWHLGHDTMITSEWGTPNMVEGGLDPEILMRSGYGHRLHLWDLRRRRHLQALDLGEEYQMALVLRPAHDPTKTYGFSGTVVCLEDLSSSIWLWYREDDGKWAIRKVIDIPAEPADPDLLLPMLKDCGTVQPLITDLNLSLDDRFLYVSCWGTGELHQYGVSDPFTPRQMGSVHLGGIVRKTAHPSAARSLNGGPQMVEISRDGCRVYFGNSLYSEWDKQFYRSSTPEPEHSSSSERTS